jgi:hypothetical protein
VRMQMTTWWLLAALPGCTSAWNQGEGPYTAAEVDRALAPVRALETRCYAGSQTAAAKRAVRLEFILYIDERGRVRSDPVLVDARDPALTQCMRKGLDELRFEPKNEADQLHLNFELGPGRTAATKE